MNALVEKALPHWGMKDANYQLIAARENQVYKVASGSRTVALRLHRQGYRSDAELRSELQWMHAASIGGIMVPAPIPSQSGDLLKNVDGTQVDVLTWLSGSPIAEMIDEADPNERCRIFRKIGQQMALLHQISDVWMVPDGFVRPAWNREGLLGERPLWDRFWDNPGLSDADRTLLLAAREKANVHLAKIETGLDYGLIHADLVSANVLIDGDTLQFIDFDDGGYGFRLFDIATALLKFSNDEDYPQLQNALIDAYNELREIDLATLDLFIFLRATTYVGWNITRMNEAGAGDRNVRFINTACKLAEKYLR